MDITPYIYLTYKAIKEAIEKRKNEKSQPYVSYTPPPKNNENCDNSTEELWNELSVAIESIRNKNISDGFIEIK
ncbi:MAG: hypothetical protein IKY72_07360 [Bacteroidaceae bacterium]|nr:hypothetical protein [Bacteroidaceae bacterium]